MVSGGIGEPESAGREVISVAVGPRIGIDNTGEAKDYPYRFWHDGNPFVSKG
jgi:DNA-3-methyladenine glycosylase